MKTLTMIVGIYLMFLTGVCCLAAEPSAEQVLPVQDGRDAYTPSAAFGTDCFLVTWQSGRLASGDLRKGPKYNGDIVGSRVDKSGKTLDDKPFVICGAADLQEKPRLAWSGEVFLVVWQDFRNGKDWDVYAARVSTDGKVLDSEGILVSGGAHNQAKPRVAWDGKSFVVVWQDFRSGSCYEVYCARVSQQGQVLDKDGVKVASVKNTQVFNPAVASAGDGRALVVSVGGAGAAPANTSSQFVADGKLQGSPTWSVANTELRDGPFHNHVPVALAAGKDSYMLSWKTYSPFGRGFEGIREGGANAGVFDARGTWKTGVAVKGVHPNCGIVDPDVTWDGTSFVLVWHEQIGDGKGGAGDLYDVAFATRILPEGKELGPTMRLAGKLEAPACQVCVGSDGAGTSLIAYEKQPENGNVPIKIAYRILTAK